MSSVQESASRLNLLLLGGFDARLAMGQRLALGARKAQGLLAYLAMSPDRPQSRETLANLLWARSGPEQARVSLRQAVAVLRKALRPAGGEVVVFERERICLTGGTVNVDADELARGVAGGSVKALERAVALYRGDLLEGFHLLSEPFEEWLMGERLRLRGLAEAAAERLIDLYRDSGHTEHAVGAALRLVGLDPLSEGARRTLMELYAQTGRPALALREFELLRGALHRESGSEPGEETRALAERLRGRPAGVNSTALGPTPMIPVPPAHGSTGPAGLNGAAAAAGDFSGVSRAGDTGPERRYLVLMYCGLSETTAHSERHDPEELLRALAAFRNRCRVAVEHFEGCIVRVDCNGLLACFGYPALEYSPERAARSGLQILASLADATDRPGTRTSVRIAIASGDVVVAGMNGDGSVETEITGEAVLLTTELQRLVEPGCLIVAGPARQQLGNLFQYRDLGARRLPGFREPVRVWRVLRESEGPRRFDVTRERAGLTPLVGRGEEMQLLLRRWQQARAGAGQVLLLTGEPGIGKSRLVSDFRDLLAGEPHTPLAYYGSPYRIDSPLFPVIEQIELAAGIMRGDTPAARLDRLARLLSDYPDEPGATVPLLAALMSIPAKGLYRPPASPPERRRQMTLEALQRLFGDLARKRPVLVVFEDLHYLDPSTRELLDRLVDQVPALPVMIVATQRPDSPPPWSFEPQVTSLVLRRLTPTSSETLVRQVAGSGTLTPQLIERIVARTDGVPLFIEELSKALVEAGPGGESTGREAVPDPLQDPLMARIDRLGPAKPVAQAAAVIGRRFSRTLLQLVTGLSEGALSDALGRLVDAELVFIRGTGTSTTCAFKHGMVQEAAYSTLLQPAREDLHALALQALEASQPDVVDREPELLAYHCAGAGLKEQACAYWQKAAEQAMSRSAIAEAAAYLSKALEFLPDTADGSRQELPLRIRLGRTLILSKGYAAADVEAAYARARDLCEATGDDRQLFLALLGLWRLYVSRQDLEGAGRFGQQLLALAQRQNDPHFLVEAHITRSITSHAEGGFADALEQANRAVDLYEPRRHRGHGELFGQDAGVIAQIMAAWPLWSLGYPDQALERMREAQTLARELDHPYSRAMADYCSAWLHQCRGEPETAREQAKLAIGLSTEQGFGWPLAFAGILHGWALAELGDTAEGILEIDRGIEALSAMGAELWRPHLLTLRAAALAAAGELEQGLASVSEALERIERTGEREYAVEVHRLEGEFLLRSAGPGALERAEACLLRAVETARDQQARSLELRAATDLARLWIGQGQPARARELLLPAYERFTEGFATPDLKAAKALLGSLSPGSASGTGCY